MVDVVARHTLARLLAVYGEEIEKLQCDMDDLPLGSDKYLAVKMKIDTERHKRIGALELAYVFGSITEEEMLHPYGMSNLIEKLKEE